MILITLDCCVLQMDTVRQLDYAQASREPAFPQYPQDVCLVAQLTSGDRLEIAQGTRELMAHLAVKIAKSWAYDLPLCEVAQLVDEIKEKHV